MKSIFYLKFIYFFRESIFFYRKLIIIFLIEYVSLSTEAKAMIVLLILFILLWQQARDNPYLTDDLNSVDFKATFVAFFTIFGGLLSYVTNQKVVTILVAIGIFFGNILFLYIWVKRMLILKVDTLKKKKYLKFCFPFFDKLSLG